MNPEIARKVADAVLYEGYLLYPYRRSAIKNRQRWSFGILYPAAYPEVPRGTERCSMHSECLLEADGDFVLQMELRFLHLVSCQLTPAASENSKGGKAFHAGIATDGWDEGVEHAVEFEFEGNRQRQEVQFSFPDHFGIESKPGLADQPGAVVASTQHSLTGMITVLAEQIHEGAIKLSIDVRNTTSLPAGAVDRDSALLRSLLSAHIILTVSAGNFVSLLDPPEHLHAAINTCKNIGNFPVLVGTPGERQTLLCSPIILYDYPEVAPESAGDFYDATEMDEMLTLRILTLAEDEKNEARSGDQRAVDLLARTEQSAQDQLMRTHGVIRSLRPVSEKRDE